MEARMSSADLVHRNGFGSALCRSMNEVMSALRAAIVGEEREEALDLVEP